MHCTRSSISTVSAPCVRDNGAVRVKAAYLALGVNLEGSKEWLRIWIAQTEGAKFWLQVVTELKNRGVSDIFIACVDGLKGFPEAIETVFPKTTVQLCIVHLVRYSLNYVSWKQRLEVAADLRAIYTAATASCGRAAAGRVRGEMERSVSGDQPVMAAQLGAHHPVLRLPAGNPQGDLHHQRD